MAQTQIRGSTQIKDASIPASKLSPSLNLPTSQLEEGNLFLKIADISLGSSSPIPSDPDAVIYSTITKTLLTWNSTQWVLALPTSTVSEETMPLSTRLDETANNISYIGEAVPGANGNSPVWRIKRMTELNDGDVIIEWAVGSAAFNKIWNDRLTYSYS